MNDTLIDPLYKIKVDCLCCQTAFETSRVRSSFKKTVTTDTDFYVKFKNINPNYYIVRVCPVCGFSSTENFSDKLTPQQKAAFEEKVRSNWVARNYSGKRTWAEALHTFQLALLTAQIKEEKDRVIAGLLHHIAWLHREKGDSEQEKRFLQFALSAYIKVYELEGANVNNARLMYLIGELSRRLDLFNDAVKWFSRVINDQKIMDAAMIRASRDQWAQTREDMLARQMELPEEMKTSS